MTTSCWPLQSRSGMRSGTCGAKLARGGGEQRRPVAHSRDDFEFRFEESGDHRQEVRMVIGQQYLDAVQRFLLQRFGRNRPETAAPPGPPWRALRGGSRFMKS
jgi:hypothetical protein